MTYSELLFRRQDEGIVFPEDARRLVASACDKVDINPAIFNRDPNGNPIQETYKDPADGRDIGQPPRVVFDGGRGFIRMYGLGKNGSRLLLEESGKIIQALFVHGFRSVDHREGEMRISYPEPDSYVPLYATRALVVAKKPGASQQFIKAELQGEVAKNVGEVVIRGLLSVARMLDEDLTSEKKAKRFESAIPQEIHILEGRPAPIMIREGLPAAGYKHVVMDIGRVLNGPWVAGMLRSRGYGIIRRVNPNRQGAGHA